jgi:hypothetical protein
MFVGLVEGVAAASSGEDWSGACRGVLDPDWRRCIECVMRSASECHRLSKSASETGAGERELTGVETAAAEIKRSGLLGGSGSGQDGLEGVLDSLRDSALGKIALELSENVDCDGLRTAIEGNGMEDVITGLMMGTSSGPIGDLLQKVSGTVMAKVQDGSLRIDDLLQDASRVMGAFGGGLPGGLAGMMGSMATGLNGKAARM